MAHTDSHHVDVVDRRDGPGAGLMLAIAALVVIAVVALAVLFTQPWDDDNGGVDTSPGITDDVVPGDGDVIPGDGDVVPGDGDVVPGDGGDAPAQ